VKGMLGIVYDQVNQQEAMNMNMLQDVFNVTMQQCLDQLGLNP